MVPMRVQNWSSSLSMNRNGKWERVGNRETELERSNPDVAVTHGITVILQDQWALGSHPRELGCRSRVTFHRDMVLNKNAIMKDSE